MIDHIKSVGAALLFTTSLVEKNMEEIPAELKELAGDVSDEALRVVNSMPEFKVENQSNLNYSPKDFKDLNELLEPFLNGKTIEEILADQSLYEFIYSLKKKDLKALNEHLNQDEYTRCLKPDADPNCIRRDLFFDVMIAVEERLGE